MVNKWFTTMECDGIKVDTMLDKTTLVEGDTVSGHVYVIEETDEEKIDYISLRVLKKSASGIQTIGKHGVELVGNIHTKEMEILSFEIIPDERWACAENEEIIFQTVVVLLDGTEMKDEGMITYTFLEE
ncbi:sporulation protein [Lysinibacillus sp. LZ02]|uniref:sporulation protein n=1 Tax=Lysinibacillus sp. LZ02 TaxID=3420668 RepID=UPI003D3666BE